MNDVKLVNTIQFDPDFKITNEMIPQLEDIIMKNLNIDMRKKYKPLLRKYIKTINIEENPPVPFCEEEVELVNFEDITLSEEQSRAYHAVVNGNSVAITGSAGSGKSVTVRAIVNYIKQNFSASEYGVTSTTGCSALLIKGCTLHSFLKIGLAKESPKLLYNKLSDLNKLRLNKLKILIIDELSMMDKNLFEKISEYLKYVKKLNKPFGGIQLVLSFDMAQLPPVNDSGYCFESDIWDQLHLNIFNFSKSFRQSDAEFVTMLNKLRFGNCTDDLFIRLKELLFTEYDEGIIEPIKLFSVNRMVDSINNQKLEILSKRNVLHKFPLIKVCNNNKLIEVESKRANIATDLTLCVGTQIMVTYNIYPKDSVVNGTMGLIESINEVDDEYDVIVYIYSTKERHRIPYIPFEFQDLDRHGRLTSKILFKYLPLRAAYATSIHKAQGTTLDYVETDLGKSVFAFGQAYTALSRCKTFNNIKLLDLDQDSFKCDPKVKEFYRKLGVNVD